jgi:hypothetical protein
MIGLGDRRYRRQVAGQSHETRIKGRQIILERARVVALGIAGKASGSGVGAIAKRIRAGLLPAL